MGRAGRASARTRSIGFAVAALGVLAVAAGVLWPTLQENRSSDAQSSGGVIPIPSADADAAGSYWASHLSSTASDTASAAPGAGATGGAALSGASGSTVNEALVSGSPMSVSDPLSSTGFTGVPEVGALFGTSDGSIEGQGHYCTGSVVNSPEGDVVVTAAHCVYDSSGVYTDIAFVPGYHDGQDP
ncbi:MAG TPA: trypsin-like serine protease, partial [Actinospica sp.]|nr:trypsin-like serine protease [Actinospica sp.]